MNLLRLTRTTENDEGFRAEPYKDHIGNWTIGIGATNILGVPVTANTKPITYEQARHLLYSHMFQAMLDALKFFPDLFLIESQKAEVIVMAAYQLGYPKLSKFVTLRKALMSRDWKLAAYSLRHSLWARQTPQRVERHAKTLEKDL